MRIWRQQVSQDVVELEDWNPGLRLANEEPCKLPLAAFDAMNAGQWHLAAIVFA